jgi:hypothetical protein
MTRKRPAHRWSVACGIGLLVLCTSGCGSGPDGLLKDQTSLQTEAAGVLDTIEDEATADKAISKLEELGKRAKANDDKLAELKLSSEDAIKLLEKHKAELEGAKKKLVDSMQKAMPKAPKKGADIAKATMPIHMAGSVLLIKSTLGDIYKKAAP